MAISFEQNMCMSCFHLWENESSTLYNADMNKFLAITLLAFTLPLITNCTGSAKDIAPLTPVPRDAIDPSDGMVKPAVDAFLKSARGPAVSSYDFRRVDLNGDRRRDALVLFKSPYGHWCETHGCTLLILKANDYGFETQSFTSPVREPIYATNETSKGWNDLVVRVSGRTEKAKHVALRFNGSNYPSNPEKLPMILGFEAGEHTSLFREIYR